MQSAALSVDLVCFRPTLKEGTKEAVPRYRSLCRPKPGLSRGSHNRSPSAPIVEPMTGLKANLHSLLEACTHLSISNHCLRYTKKVPKLLCSNLTNMTAACRLGYVRRWELCQYQKQLSGDFLELVFICSKLKHSKMQGTLDLRIGSVQEQALLTKRY